MALTPTQRRRRREKLEHRRAILNAAERVLAEKGFDSATMEELARESEFSVGAIYTFFDSKETLCAEVLRKIADEFGEDFRHILADIPDPLKAIEATIELRLRYMEKHAKFFRFLMDSSRGSRAFPDHAIPKSCIKQYEEYLSRIADLWRRAMAAGVVSELDAIYASLAMEGMINAFSAYWARKNMHLPIEEQMNIVRRNFLHLIVATLTEPTMSDHERNEL